MPTAEIALRLSPSAIEMLDKLRVEVTPDDPRQLTREQWAFHALRNAAAAWTARWNLVHAKGAAVVDPEGRVTVRVGDLVPVPAVGRAVPSGVNLRVTLTDIVLDRVSRMVQLNNAVRKQQGVPPFASVQDFAQEFITEVIAMSRSAQEDADEAREAEAADRMARLEAERERRRKALEAGDQEPPAEGSSSGAGVAVFAADPALEAESSGSVGSSGGSGNGDGESGGEGTSG